MTFLHNEAVYGNLDTELRHIQTNSNVKEQRKVGINDFNIWRSATIMKTYN